MGSERKYNFRREPWFAEW